MKILSLDPGLATGVALFDNENIIHQETIEGGEKGFLKDFPELYEQIANEDHRVVVERFIPNEHVQGEDAIYSNRIEGMVMVYTNNQGIIWHLRSDKALLFNQKKKLAAGEAERFQWLRRKGFKGGGHELDAITHALVYMKRLHFEPAIRKYWLS